MTEQRFNYNFLLASLIGLLAFMPFRALHFPLAETISALLHTIVLFSGILTCRKHKQLRIISTIISAPALILNWFGSEALTNHEEITLISLLILYSFLIFIIIADIVKYHDISKKILAGSLSAYLLFGMAFAIIYTLLQIFDPNAFLLPDVREISGITIDEGDPHSKYYLPTFIYHSFVTLSTLGYGDIQPQTFPARFLSIVEAVVGQIYLVVIVAGIVGIKASHFFDKKGEN